uniref:Beta-galactosidase n=1 Tax=Anser cygnoides TaxID=8845 RepID=A0A8B9E7T2_ANSCY
MRLWGRTLGLQTENSQFLLEGMPFRIFGGSMHYFRVPREYWEDRMLKMKACGLNTLTTYVPWNLHEQTRGKFDFSQDLDLEAFLSLAAKNGLWVILRPGPYICSEWDLGGLPSWLLQDPEMQLRTTYKGFTEAVDAYFDRLMPIVVPLQYKKGGPIIAVQVENEYGSYAKDPNYMAYVKMALLSRGIVELLMTSDNKNGLSFGLVEGALATVNFQKLEPGVLKYLDTVQRDQPKMVMEYWTGWFDNWGGPHYVFDADEMVNTVASILKLGASINLYMFHGGTNFGFMNGALEADEYKSDVTSYDYDAVLTEAGDYTSKFFKLRQLFSAIIGQPLPLPPMIESKASYGAILLHQYISLWDVLPSLIQPIKSEFPVNMENLRVNDSSGQSYGYVLYETVIFGGGHLHSRDHVRDRAQGFRQLRLLVENRGRVNYGLALNEQRKGKLGSLFLEPQTVLDSSTTVKLSFLSTLHRIKLKTQCSYPSYSQDVRGTVRQRDLVNKQTKNQKTMKQKKPQKTKPSVNLILLQFRLVMLGYPFLLLCVLLQTEKTFSNLCFPLGFEVEGSWHFKTHTIFNTFRRNELHPVEQNLLKCSSPLHTIVELEEVETPGFYFSGEMYTK